MLTSHGHIGDALVGPTSTNIAMISRKPDLLQVCDTFVGSRTLPDRRAERRSRLVHGQSMEGILDSVGQLRVIEPELRCCVIKAKLLHPRNRRNPKAAHGVEDRNCLDGDELATATAFKDSCQAILDEQASVVLCSVFPHGFVVKGDARVRILVFIGEPVLHVFEDWEEEFHALAGQEAEASDHAGDASSCEGATREADEDDFIAVDVVATYERVTFTYVLHHILAGSRDHGSGRMRAHLCNTIAKGAAREGVRHCAARSNPRLVVDDLD